MLLRWMMQLAATRPGGWFFTTVAPPIDRLLLRLTNGRVNSGIVAPILLLVTTGRKSGQPRSTPLLHLRDEGRFVLIASNGGSRRHPDWYHNLRAHPDATVLIGGRTIACRAHEAQGDERARLWRLAADYNPGYDTYQQRAERRIPVMVLTPSAQ